MYDDDNDEIYLTEDGLFECIDIHQHILDGWKLEQIAEAHGHDKETIQVLLAIFYHYMDQANVDLGVYVPDTVEGIV